MNDNNYKKGLVSFCCLSYKHGAFIKDCLESILNQSYKNIEIIALDDGSPDDSGKILTECSKKSPVPITVILQNNTANVPKNFNTMLNKAKGEFVFFISMDDYIENDAISSKMDLFNENIAFIANKLNNKVDANNEIICKNESPYMNWAKETHTTARDLLELEYNHLGAFYIQGAVFRRNIIDAIGGFDDDLIGDDIILRTKLFIYMIDNVDLQFVLLNKSAVNYRIHDSNIHKNSFRQVLLIKEWKDRYFPDKDGLKLLFHRVQKAYAQNIASYNLCNCSKLISILDELLLGECESARQKYIKQFFKYKKVKYL